MKIYICPTCGETIRLENACTVICKTCGEQHKSSDLTDRKLSVEAIARADIDDLVDFVLEGRSLVPHNVISATVKRAGKEINYNSLLKKLATLSRSKVNNMIGDVYYEKGNFSEAHKYYNLSEDKDSNEHLFRYYSTRYYTHDYVTYETYGMEDMVKALQRVKNRASEAYIKTECTNIIAKLEGQIASTREHEKRRQEELSRFVSPTEFSSPSGPSKLSDDDAFHAIITGMMNTDITGLT